MATSTYTPIATYTVTGSAVASYTFSSISSAYTDLVVVLSPQGPASGIESLRLRFNSDTGSNYSTTWMRGDGTSASSGRESSNTSSICGRVGGQTGVWNFTKIDVLNYSNTTTNKTFLTRSSAPISSAGETWANAGLWRSTAAITSITLLMDSSSFAVGSTFSLYGIKAA